MPMLWFLCSTSMRIIAVYTLFIFSDDRVSEETATLIRGLLVLSPHKRMTANEVLITLERIMSIWYVIM